MRLDAETRERRIARTTRRVRKCAIRGCGALMRWCRRTGKLPRRLRSLCVNVHKLLIGCHAAQSEREQRRDPTSDAGVEAAVPGL